MYIRENNIYIYIYIISIRTVKTVKKNNNLNLIFAIRALLYAMRTVPSTHYNNILDIHA